MTIDPMDTVSKAACVVVIETVTKVIGTLACGKQYLPSNHYCDIAKQPIKGFLQP